MKILFDYQAFEMQNMGGISRSFVELCKQLGLQKTDIQIGIKESDNVYLKKNLLVSDIRPLRYTHDLVFGKTQSVKGQWKLTHSLLSLFGQKNDFLDVNRRLSINLIKTQEFDIFHPTFFDTYFLPYLNNKPFVLTIHDMIPELYPQYFRRDDFQIVGKQILAPKASAIIAVSETTKRDVVRILNVPEEKIHVLYHGCSMSPLTDIHKIYDFPYVLYVGERDGYKNFTQFITGAADTIKRHDDLRIVCTGKPFTPRETALFSYLGIADRIHHIRAINDDELYSLYHYAECFVYPSDYEGFGIPVLEAYAADCPVLLNNASCFPEIAGDAAVYFSFGKQFDLNDKLEFILTLSADNREKLLAKQRGRLKCYSWQDSARKLADIYQTIV